MSDIIGVGCEGLSVVDMRIPQIDFMGEDMTVFETWYGRAVKAGYNNNMDDFLKFCIQMGLIEHVMESAKNIVSVLEQTKEVVMDGI